MGNPIRSIFERAQRVVTAGLERSPQNYLYLDRRALNEHYQAITGTSRVPVFTRETLTSGVGVEFSLLALFKLSGKTESAFELSDFHLFESLEPELRRNHPVAKAAADLEASLRSFVWLSGKLSWHRMVPEDKDGREGAATLSYVLEAAGLPLMLICRDESFSPFAPFFIRNPHLYKMVFEVEVFAYNPGILGQYTANPHPASGLSLALVPTVIIVTDAEQRAQIADWIKKLNAGKLSRSYGI